MKKLRKYILKYIFVVIIFVLLFSFTCSAGSSEEDYISGSSQFGITYTKWSLWSDGTNDLDVQQFFFNTYGIEDAFYFEVSNHAAGSNLNGNCAINISFSFDDPAFTSVSFDVSIVNDFGADFVEAYDIQYQPYNNSSYNFISGYPVGGAYEIKGSYLDQSVSGLVKKHYSLPFPKDGSKLKSVVFGFGFTANNVASFRIKIDNFVVDNSYKVANFIANGGHAEAQYTSFDSTVTNSYEDKESALIGSATTDWNSVSGDIFDQSLLNPNNQFFKCFIAASKIVTKFSEMPFVEQLFKFSAIFGVIAVILGIVSIAVKKSFNSG